MEFAMGRIQTYVHCRLDWIEPFSRVSLYIFYIYNSLKLRLIKNHLIITQFLCEVVKFEWHTK